MTGGNAAPASLSFLGEKLVRPEQGRGEVAKNAFCKRVSNLFRSASATALRPEVVIYLAFQTASKWSSSLRSYQIAKHRNSSRYHNRARNDYKLS